MRAELVIDLNDLGMQIGRAKGQGSVAYPVLSQVAAMWKTLGVEVSAMHLVAPRGGRGQKLSAAERLIETWWKTESIFLDDTEFTVSRRWCAREDKPRNGRLHGIGLDALVTTTALRRSDELHDLAEDTVVIVMSNSPFLTSVAQHARGVPVVLGSANVSDTTVSHIRLKTNWMGALASRVGTALPKAKKIAHSRELDASTKGRHEAATTLATTEHSLLVYDPQHFHIVAGRHSAKVAKQLAGAIELLGFGHAPHVLRVTEDVSEAELFARLYRFMNDHPNLNVAIASSRPSIITALAAPSTYSMTNPRRIQRLCLDSSASILDDGPYLTRHAASRVVLEAQVVARVDDGLSAIDISGTNSTDESRREASQQWRKQAERRFVLLGADGKEATLADSTDGRFLPVSISDCPDFALRPPALRPGLVVEAILSNDRSEWVIVSDPIERRKHRREEQLTEEQILAMRKRSSRAA